MFGNDSAPTKNFQYGVIGNYEFEGRERVLEQIKLGHRYRNKLVELEHRRRAEELQIVQQYAPGLPELDEQVAALDEKIKVAREAVQQDKVKRRNRVADKAMGAVVRALTAERKPLYDQQKVLRARVRAAKKLPEMSDEAKAKMAKVLKPLLAEMRQQEAHKLDKIRELRGPLVNHRTPEDQLPPVPPALKPMTRRELSNKIVRALADAGLKTDLPPVWFDNHLLEMHHGARMLEARWNSQLFWGTYLAIEQSAKEFRKGAPPQFLSFRGDGRVAVEIIHGMPFADVLAGKDTRLALIPRETKPHPSTPRTVDGPHRHRQLRHTQRYWLKIRVGTLPGGRKPQWAVLPATIHRMPPAEGLVKWAYLHRRMVGQQEQWRLTFSVSMPGGFPAHPELASSGAVGIDVGWRVMPSGDLRMAYYHGSDGEHQAVQLPPEVLAGFRIIDSIQGFRKGMFNTVRDALQEFLQGTKGLPDILQKQVESIDKWKSNRRLAHLVAFWRQYRDDLRTIGDRSAPQPLLAWAQGEAKRILEIDRVRRLEGATERLLSSQRRKSLTSVARSELSVYEVLHFWASRENHLFEYEAHGRQQLAAKRLDHYRVVAAALRRSYSTVVLEGDEKGEVDKDGKLKLMDLTKFGAKAPPEGDEVQRKEQRRVARLAAPGEFRQVLIQTGMQVVPIQAAYTSSDCPRCHHRNDYNRARLYFVCAGCGERQDQDHVAAQNLLAAAAPALLG